MTVPRLPTMSVPASRPKLSKIALEEAYATKAGVKLDDGNPDWAWFMEENALNRPYMDAVAPRLLDFGETRLQAMDESGIEYIVNSLTCPGIERILDAKEAQEAATACNDFLANQIQAHPNPLRRIRHCGHARSGCRRRRTGTMCQQARLQRGPVQRVRPAGAGRTTWSTSTTPATRRSGRR